MNSFMIPANGQNSNPQQMARARVMQAMLGDGAPQSVPDAMNRLGAGLSMAMMNRPAPMSTQSALSSLGAAAAPMGAGNFPAAPGGPNIFGGVSSGLHNLFSKL